MDDLFKRKISQYFLLHSDDYVIDDITYNDLNLDNVFEKINKTSSSLGEEVLYSILRTPVLEKDVLDNRETDIQYYSDNKDKRIHNQKLLSNLSKLKKISVFEYLAHIGQVKPISFFSKILATLLLIVSAVLIFVNTTVGIILFAVSYCINVIRYFKLRDNIIPYLISVSYLSKAVSLGEKIPNINKDNYRKIHFLKYGSLFIGTVSGATVNNGSGNPLDIIIDFIKMGFHYDIIKFYSLANKISSNYENIDKYLSELGYIDACISISLYRESLNEFCIPNILDNKEQYIKINGLYHPLLNKPVSNNIVANGGILLTGANASGKSTFLRAVALNVLFAQTIHTCCCLEYNAPTFRIISSMSVSDSITKNESFYIAEIKALKRIIDASDISDSVKVLCFVDEVLRGTNTKERIASSTNILRYLNERALCFAATHDIELTYLLEEHFTNYHFDEDVCEKDISFSYKLKTGRAQSTNAIKLLKVMDFPSNIINDSLQLIENGFDTENLK